MLIKAAERAEEAREAEEAEPTTENITLSYGNNIQAMTCQAILNIIEIIWEDC